MPRGVSRDPEERAAELDQEIARLQARKETLLAREKQRRKRRDEQRARVAGEAVRRVYGSWQAPELLTWIERLLISDRERSTFGFEALEQGKKAARQARLREREARWEQTSSGDPPSVADGRANRPDGGRDTRDVGSSGGTTPPVTGETDPGDESPKERMLQAPRMVDHVRGSGTPSPGTGDARPAPAPPRLYPSPIDRPAQE